MSRFAGNYLKPDAGATVLELQFGQPVRAIALTFATLDVQANLPATPIRLTAFHAAVPVPTVGTVTATGVRRAGDSFPMGMLALESALPFNSVRIDLPSVPQGATEFAIDNVAVAVAVPESFSLDLAMGWNQVSLPCEPIDARCNQILNAPGGHGAVVLGPVWTWGAGNQRYEQVSDLHAFQGYWVYAVSPGPVPVTGVAVNPEMMLSPGWNLIGPVWLSVPGPVSLPLITEPAGGITGEFWLHNGSHYRTARDSLQQGTAYWVWSSAACRVRFGP